MSATPLHALAARHPRLPFVEFERARLAALQADPDPPLSFGAYATRSRVVSEGPDDEFQREHLLDTAFGPERFKKPSEQLRAGRVPAWGLSPKIEERGEMIGTLRLWRIYAGVGRPALLLGPLAVSARRRGEGLGAALVEESLARARRLGHRAVLLVGDAAYYGRFGFTRRLTETLLFPGDIDLDRFLAVELFSSALNGARGRVIAPTRVF
jgi:predicted N-acetyltransferase YhbS